MSFPTVADTGVETIAFTNTGDFEACHKAEAWCAERGISVGRMQRGAPRGLMRGDCDIQKWRNLRGFERGQLDGVMTGNMRSGPVLVTVKRAAIAKATEG